MSTVKILNFYSFYINKIITFYYIIGTGNSGHLRYDNFTRFNEAINLMELGFGSRRAIAVVTPVAIEVDIEMPLPKLTLIHPDDCCAYSYNF